MHAIAQTNIRLYGQLRDEGWADADVVRVGNAYQCALPIFALRFRASGKPFLAHLVGTASILAAQGASPDVTIAGLLHAAYTQGDFDGQPFGTTEAKRKALRGAIGIDAESLVADYSAFDWDQALADGIGATAIDDHRMRTIVLMRLANELEDHIDDGMAYCAKASRATVVGRAAAIVRLAESLGYPHLAVALGEAMTGAHTVPSGLVSPDRGSFTLDGRAPRNGIGWWHRMRRLAGR